MGVVWLGRRFLMQFLPLYLLHDEDKHKSVVPSHRFVEEQTCLTDICCSPNIKQF